MKHATLLVFGMAFLSQAVQSDQTPVSMCVEALEQLKTLQTAAPVYKLTGNGKRQYLSDADRPAEISRLKIIVVRSCSAKPGIKRREDSDAEQLHVERSPGCIEDRDMLSIMEKPESRTPEDDLTNERKRVTARCPDVDLSNVWLVEWMPPTAPQ